MRFIADLQKNMRPGLLGKGGIGCRTSGNGPVQGLHKPIEGERLDQVIHYAELEPFHGVLQRIRLQNDLGQAGRLLSKLMPVRSGR